MQRLDNPVWNALATTQREISLGNDLARRYLPDISPIAAIADPSDPACWAALGDLVGFETPVGITNPGEGAPPAGWAVEWRFQFLQMTCTKQTFVPSPGIAGRFRVRELTIADGPDMVALARLTQPGPMEVRTVTMGRYLGAFDESGVLISMAGERTQFDGFIEVSGVCTHPEHRGKGAARTLVSSVTEAIVDKGCVAFLNVRDNNLAAADVYRKLGFEVRKAIDIAMVRKT
jgi:GNAT superfamily N-acetyltransferase